MLLLTVAGCAGNRVGDSDKMTARLDGDAVKRLLTGSTIHLVEYDGAADVTLAADGTAMAVNMDRQKDSGFWGVDDQGRFCLRFKKWGFADTLCYEVYPKEENAFRLTVQPGGAYASMTVEKAMMPPLPVNPQLEPQTATITKNEEFPAGQEQRAGDYSGPVMDKPGSSSYAREDVRYIMTMMARDCEACNLRNISLPGADLSNARLAGADLSGADFTGARLRNADLQKSDLSRARLVNADMSGADLRDADFFGADLTGANLKGARIKGAKGLPR